MYSNQSSTDQLHDDITDDRIVEAEFLFQSRLITRGQRGGVVLSIFVIAVPSTLLHMQEALC